MTKVEHTRQHNGKLVTDAELVLVECKPEEALLTEITYLETGIVSLVTDYDKRFSWDGFKFKYYKPILISRTEKIEVGQVWDGFEKRIAFVDDVKKYEPYNHLCKILALPEHFSPEHLQMIVDNKLKNGDKVAIECEENDPRKSEYYSKLSFDTRTVAMEVFYDEGEFNQIKLNPYITIYPVEERMRGYNDACDLLKEIMGEHFSEYIQTRFKKKWFDEK